MERMNGSLMFDFENSSVKGSDVKDEPVKYHTMIMKILLVICLSDDHVNINYHKVLNLFSFDYLLEMC
jgi:hypothetical protein